MKFTFPLWLFVTAVLSHEDHTSHHHRGLLQTPQGCGFQAPDHAAITRMALAVQEERVQKKGCLFRCNPERSASIHVDTYIYAIEMEDGTGFLENAVIEANVKMTNELLLPTGFQLNVISIHRITNDLWYLSEPGSKLQDDMENQYGKGDLTTLNVYFKVAITDGERACGYASMAEDAPSLGSHDNIVIDTGCAIRKVVLAHEFGHWMNLLHTFDGGCFPGDLVDDTNAQASFYKGETEDCPNPFPDTCPDQPGLDPLDNIMDYAPLECRVRSSFTPGQIKRMREAWDTIRNV